MVGIVIDDAIVVLENIFRFVEEKAHELLRGGARRDRRDRPGGHGDDFQPGRHLRAGRFHVEHLRTFSLSIRHHCGGRRAGELLVSFTLTPMMSARMLRAEDAAAGGDDAHSRQGFYAWLDCRYERMLAWSMAHRVAVMIARRRGASSRRSRSTRWCARNISPPTSMKRSSTSTSPPLKASAWRPWTRSCRRRRKRDCAPLPLVRLLLCDAGGGFIGGVGRAAVTCASRPTMSGVFSFTPPLARDLRRPTLGRIYRITSQRDVMQQVRARPSRKYTDLRVFGAQRAVVQHRRRQLGYRFRSARTGS